MQTTAAQSKLSYINALISKSIIKTKICVCYTTNSFATNNNGKCSANEAIMDKINNKGQWENKCKTCFGRYTCYSANNSKLLTKLSISNKL